MSNPRSKALRGKRNRDRRDDLKVSKVRLEASKRLLRKLEQKIEKEKSRLRNIGQIDSLTLRNLKDSLAITKHEVNGLGGVVEYQRHRQSGL